MLTDDFEWESRAECIRVKHNAYNAAMVAILNLIKRSGKVADPGGLRIVAESGVGKTAIIESIQNIYPDVETPMLTTISVLRITLSVQPTIKGIVDSFLTALNFLNVGRMTVPEKTTVLLKALKECGVLIILLDEANHLAEGDRKLTSYDIADWLKRLYDESRIPIVFLGTAPGLDRLFDINAQLKTRLPAKMEIKKFRNGIPFRKFLKAYDTSLPIRGSGLDNPIIADKIHQATDGRMRSIVKLVLGALGEAHRSQAESITIKHLEESFDLVFGLSGPIVNPFRNDALPG